MASDDGTDNAVAQLQQRVDALQAEAEKKETRIRELQEQVKKAVDTQAKNRERFYLTTAIHYTNGNPHMGHAYENVTSDVISRYHRTFGRDVFFLTGTDEHGQKIAQTAEAAGMTPIELCNKYAGTFQQLTKDLDMSNNHFVRTTSAEHKKFAQWLFQRALDAGDIYLGTYEGWYNVKEETFVTETEAQQTDYKDPATGVPYKKMKESSYFFKMSKYQERLVQHFHNNPEFLQPEVRRQEILRRLEEPLQDLSCSRTTFSHGVPLPNDPEHVMYVWFDALSNYLSALDYPNGENAKYWPASVHIIGKDIIWFHCVIWPCILMSAGLPLPKRVFAHGFVNAKDGTKMSKSIGNVVDPYDIMSKFGLDSFRYFIIRGARYGHDMPFSEDDLMNIHNSELADTLGNLVHRAVSICQKYSEGVVPAVSTPDSPFDVYSLLHESEVAYKDFALQNACLAIVSALRDTNKYLTDKAPWHMKEAEPRHVVVRTCLEAIYVLAHYLSPIMPATADKIFAKLGKGPVALTELSPNFDNLTPGTPVTVGDILFAKVLSEEELKKQEESAKAKAAPKPVKAEKATVPLFASLDIRVGEITRVWEHPDSDKLYCEEIDVGDEEGPKQIGSGLRPFYTLQQMQGRKVLVLLNLKPAKLGGFKSHGMVLCASDESHERIEFIEPPADAKVGERVFIDTESGEPLSAAQLKKQKAWEKAAVDLLTNEEGVATYKGNVIKTSAGPCRAKTLTKAQIS
ncbi:TPA: hypothetical protein N0F65_002125 [Lagenidium giganteum]|uniref:methionine--tRNA ligase n=1 Tax=Lagenidium giganteum TaxID=4803 RepID=A0AAV2ZAB8_9STRA|nr:TPA: hypothetical protein N0F65_002125 [Lagenidium giganteum]